MRIFIAIIALLATLYADATFELNLSSQKAYLNEPVVATFRLKYANNQKPRYIKFDDFIQNGVNAKFISKVKKVDLNTTTISYKYLLFIQNSNIDKIAKQELKVAYLEPKTSRVIWQSLYSNSLSIATLPIPKESVVVGNLALDINSSKSQDSVVNVDITLKGRANLEDIKPFNLKIKGATIYKEKPSIEYNVTNGELKAIYKQSFTIFAQNSIEIPSLDFIYFNSDTQMLEHLKSKAIKVDITNRQATKNRALYIAVGIAIGALLMLLFLELKKLISKVKLPLKRKIELAPTNKALYRVLLPYAKEYNLDDIIRKLEENIYSGSKHKISKREIINSLEKS